MAVRRGSHAASLSRQAEAKQTNHNRLCSHSNAPPALDFAGHDKLRRKSTEAG